VSLETASFVADLVTSNPDGGDQRSTADDHLRLIKAVLRRTFPKLDAAVSLSAAQIHYSNDLSASVQLQLNQLRDGSATANNALYANSASFASVAATANSASFAALAATANSASYAALAGTAALALTANSASYAALAGTAALALTANSASYAALAGAASSADFANSASSAASLAGYPPSDVSGANTVVVRDNNGDSRARYYFASQPDDENPTVDQLVVRNGTDNYYRLASVTHAGQYIAGQNITGRTGTAKTLSSSSPSGGSNGDIWYQYA
jgi:hypothetical protein